MLPKISTTALSLTLMAKILYNAFTIQNNREGFDELYQKILFVEVDMSNIKVGLEATGHYNYNLLGYLIDKGLPTYVINPLHTNLYRKVSALERRKRIRWMPEPLLCC